MTIDPTILEAVAVATDDLDVELYDVEWAGRILRISLDRSGGVDLDTLSTASRRIGAALDLADAIPGAYQLEVGSPGLERSLRTPAHWLAARGRQVRIKTRPDAGGNRRLEGVIDGVTGDVATVRTAEGAVVQVDLADVDRARTVFAWGAAPKPGGPKTGSAKTGNAKAGNAKTGGQSDTTISRTEPAGATAPAPSERAQTTGERA